MSTQPIGITNETASVAPGRSSRSYDRGFLPEAKFLSALCWERRRSERSGNALLLALVHLDGTKWDERNVRSIKTAAIAVCSVARGTDTVGWHKNNKSLGVIFTDLRKTGQANPQNSIDAKLKLALCSALPAEMAENIRITYHVYPESDGNSGSGDPILHREGSQHSKLAGVLKRCMDVVGSLLALVALSPLMALITLAVKLTSEGPVWFRQTRVGEGGRTFTFLKFRSMFHNNDPSLHRNYVTSMIAGEDVARTCATGGRVYKIVDDPRVTRVGKILRCSSLDELPQFFNVLKGDMSLVGPRPPLPYEFERYSAWHRRRVLEVKPGLTGLWQVSARSKTSFDEMVRLDLRYARQWSLWLDIKILLKTPAAVIFRAGAY